LDEPNPNQREDSEHITGNPPPAVPDADPSAQPPSAEPDPRSFHAWLVFRLTLMLMVTAGILGILIAFGPSSVVYGALVLVGLGFVIFIHELGHFAVAKWCDVYVETFSIGFGPALPGCSYKKGETTYMIGIIPLGGYVKMLGEGAEDDPEGEEDNPRSYKNKSVPQRMAIISAGVIMNVIFGCIAFIIVYMAHGEEQFIGAVGIIDSGSPAWIKGAPTGAVLDRIGDKEKPTFNDLKATVPLAGTGKIDFWYHLPGKPEVKTSIEPRRSADDKFPMIGIGPATSLSLPPDAGKSGLSKVPYWKNSAASQAKPPFEFGDKIIAMTDPADPTKVTDLPKNLRNSESKQKDYYAFRERLEQLAGQDITVQVERSDGKKVDLQVPPAYHTALGLRMKMGRVVAVRQMPDGSKNPVQYKNQDINAANAAPKEGDEAPFNRNLVLVGLFILGFVLLAFWLRTEDRRLAVVLGLTAILFFGILIYPLLRPTTTEVAHGVSGDIIKAVEVVEPGGFRSRWVLDRTAIKDKPVASSADIASLIGLAAGSISPAGVGALGDSITAAGLAPMVMLAPTLNDGVLEHDIDPMRLPYELEQWAQRRGKADKVTLIVGRTVDKKEDTPVALELPWDDQFRFNQEIPLGLSSPVSIPGLGIAYNVETTVESVAPDSPATHARILLAPEGEGPQGAAAPWYRSPSMLLMVGIVFLVLVGVSRTNDARVSVGLGLMATLLFGFGLFQMLRPAESPAQPEQAKRYSPFQLQKGDVITEVRFYSLAPNKDGGGYTPEPARKPIELKQNQWAFAFSRLQNADTEVKQLGLKVERQEGGKTTTYRDIIIEGKPDHSWPMVDRGLVFMPDTRMKKADGIGEAIGMGYTKTVNFIEMVYKMLRRLVTGDIAADNIGGPLMIFMTGKDILDFGGFFGFLGFLGLISVNLAVVNFLPIPVLDGGHFVFLLYEGLRGKPASEKVRIATTYVGLILIITLMGFVIWMDVKRYFL
jgi:RIP metalloprotease RseP